MNKRTSYEIKKEILYCVKERPSTYAQLERKVNTGFQTIKSNTEELEKFGNVEIEEKPYHDANGRPYHRVKITERGKDFLETLQK